MYTRPEIEEISMEIDQCMCCAIIDTFVPY